MLRPTGSLAYCWGMREHPIRERLSLVAPRENGIKNETGEFLSMQYDVGDDFEGDDSECC